MTDKPIKVEFKDFTLLLDTDGKLNLTFRNLGPKKFGSIGKSRYPMPYVLFGLVVKADVVSSEKDLCPDIRRTLTGALLDAMKEDALALSAPGIATDKPTIVKSCYVRTPCYRYIPSVYSCDDGLEFFESHSLAFIASHLTYTDTLYSLPFVVKVDSDASTVLIDAGFGVKHAVDLWESYLVLKDICDALLALRQPLRPIHERVLARACHNFAHHYSIQEAKKSPDTPDTSCVSESPGLAK